MCVWGQRTPADPWPAPVFEIILEYLEKGSWEEAFFSILPQRKGAVALAAAPPGGGGASGMATEPSEDPLEQRP